ISKPLRLWFPEQHLLDFLSAGSVPGLGNLQMPLEQPLKKKKSYIIYIILLSEVWECFLLSPFNVLKVSNKSDCSIVSFRSSNQRTSLKYSSGSSAGPGPGRATAGTPDFSVSSAYKLPRFRVISYIKCQHNPLFTNSSLFNIPIVKMINTNTKKILKISVPENSQSSPAWGCGMWKMSSRTFGVKGQLSRGHSWPGVPDYYKQDTPSCSENKGQVIPERPKKKEKFNGSTCTPTPQLTAT
uniref:Uncharacterized protein n=1 Tax=Sus scrofa TaxID=9823 RepID=A0A8D0PZZ8_PIG